MVVGSYGRDREVSDVLDVPRAGEEISQDDILLRDFRIESQDLIIEGPRQREPGLSTVGYMWHNIYTYLPSGCWSGACRMA